MKVSVLQVDRYKPILGLDTSDEAKCTGLCVSAWGGGTLGDEQAEEWPTADWFAGWPQPVSALPRTAGQSPQQCRRIGQPAKWEPQESRLCQHLSSQRG